MQYMVLIYQNESHDGLVDWTQLGKDYKEYAAAATQAGVMRGGEKLQPSTATTTVAVRDGERRVTKRPFDEAQEQLGGFFMLECVDFHEALEWAARCPGASHGTVEIRPVMPT
ncbi:YciI family protein [Streptomyces gibsoniae]|uniref:YciI family protein n=1 Tax=Streptomyces gibsoniae TaxID=3075529 RepID=A0ABU2U6H8_9ACTN|nr:YciI family protein [Streptomyces sp. DSM 41699]MDT0468646.1 YciI family protein [Streptomyces sp. DSM 41699]